MKASTVITVCSVELVTSIVALFVIKLQCYSQIMRLQRRPEIHKIWLFLPTALIQTDNIEPHLNKLMI